MVPHISFIRTTFDHSWMIFLNKRPNVKGGIPKLTGSSYRKFNWEQPNLGFTPPTSRKKGTCDGQRLAPGGGEAKNHGNLFVPLKNSFKVYNYYYDIQVTIVLTTVYLYIYIYIYTIYTRNLYRLQLVGDQSCNGR